MYKLRPWRSSNWTFSSPQIRSILHSLSTSFIYIPPKPRARKTTQDQRADLFRATVVELRCGCRPLPLTASTGCACREVHAQAASIEDNCCATSAGSAEYGCCTAAVCCDTSCGQDSVSIHGPPQEKRSNIAINSTATTSELTLGTVCAPKASYVLKISRTSFSVSLVDKQPKNLDVLTTMFEDSWRHMSSYSLEQIVLARYTVSSSKDKQPSSQSAFAGKSSHFCRQNKPMDFPCFCLPCVAAWTRTERKGFQAAIEP